MTRMYYRSNGNNTKIVDYDDELVLKWDSDTFSKWIDSIDFDAEMTWDDSDYIWAGNGSGDEAVYYFNISEDWKHTLIDRLVMDIDIHKVEKMINEIGIRHVMWIVNRCDYFQDEKPDFETDMGFRKVLYCILDYIIGIGDFEEIDEDAWNRWNEETFPSNDTDDEDETDDETDDDDEDIGGKVAPCA